MVILGVDSSARQGVVGLVGDTELLGEVSIDMGTTHLRRLVPVIKYLLDSSSVSVRDVDLFVVTLGPGSWSGIRIGVTTVRVMAQTLGKPVVGVCSLDVLAHNLAFTNRLVYPIIDASRGQVYFAGYRCDTAIPERVLPYGIRAIDHLLDTIETPAVFLGDGILKYRDEIAFRSRSGMTIGPTGAIHARGRSVVEAGLQRFNRGEVDDPDYLTPLYMQGAGAEGS